jgi:16S rRNA (guanine(966)-N(2))-methyltransferase RsmD
MRVIAGTFRSRRLESIPGDATRPTPDRVREALFNILQARIEGASFVDAYAGTGAVGIEALSRGAAHAWFLERDRRALDAIRKNLGSLGVERRATILAGKVLVTLDRCPAGIVFLDPPYDMQDEYTGALQLLGEKPPVLTIAQHSVHLKLKDAYGALHRTRMVKHGDNALSFYAV